MEQGTKFGERLMQRMGAENSSLKPFVFDIRGSGCFWAVEFDFENPEAAAYDFKGKHFGPLVQAQCMSNNLIILGMNGGASVDGQLGEHAIFAPPYNITDEEIEKIVDVFARSAEEVLEASRR